MSTLLQSRITNVKSVNAFAEDISVEPIESQFEHILMFDLCIIGHIAYSKSALKQFEIIFNHLIHMINIVKIVVVFMLHPIVATQHPYTYCKLTQKNDK